MTVPASGRTTSLRLWSGVAALAAAGALHLAAAGDHTAAGGVVVGFFLVTALLQWVVAMQLTLSYWRSAAAGPPSSARPAPVWVLLAIAGSAALIALYVVVHTTDLLAPLAEGGGQAHAGSPTPPAPAAGIGEPVDALGVITVVVEVAGIAALAGLVPSRRRAAVRDGLVALALLIWVLWLAAGPV